VLAVSGWYALKLTGVVASALAVFVVVQFVHLAAVVAWGDHKTRGLNYYGRPSAERSRFKRMLYVHGLILSPTIWLLGRTARVDFSKVCFLYQGVPGLKGTCSPESFRRAVEYRPRSDDVFVATPMKCGTTWMQHVVYQVLTRGAGDLVASGTTLYAVSPWIESLRSVSIDDAPRWGAEKPSRVIKTHLPAQLCPYSPEAKYVYVARHPLSCFASCADFIATNLGTFVPPMETLEAWFRSGDLMWWGTWPSHVRGWWERSQRHRNVLFVTFEQMKSDLAATVRQVAGFLEMGDLEQREIDAIVRKCSFDYMREHAEAFEMYPPHVLQSRGAFFVSGKADRHRDVPEAVARRIVAWCRSELRGTDFPLARYYPDVAQAAPALPPALS